MKIMVQVIIYGDGEIRQRIQISKGEDFSHFVMLSSSMLLMFSIIIYTKILQKNFPTQYRIRKFQCNDEVITDKALPHCE
uniref:Uncharacterized protein n=1 Tax=Onchocerca volvulus TaxID=6282 RepID=A0A8R1XYH2_ONCVO